MKNTYKRLMCLALAMTLTLTICGCGSTSDGTRNTTEPSTTETGYVEDTSGTESAVTNPTQTETEPSENGDSTEAETFSTEENATTAPTEIAGNTEPSETKPADFTEPSSQPTEAETKPVETKSSETEPEETTPVETKPAETKPAETEPEETRVTETEHKHSYSSKVVNPTCTEKGYTVHTCSCGDSYTDSEKAAKGHSYSSKVVNPTCTEKGYTVHTCSCGDSYRDNEKEAKGHSYKETVVEPTTTSQGYTQHTCSACGYSYKDNYTEMIPVETQPEHDHEFTRTSGGGTCVEGGYYLYECSCGYSYKEPNGLDFGEHYFEWVEAVEATPEHSGYILQRCKLCGYEFKDEFEYVEPTEPVELDPYEVAQAVAKYINQFRAEQGSTQLTYLTGMSQVAQYRSVQLITNFAHDTADIREAMAYYQYGEYIDMSAYGYESYYSADGGEAIGQYTGSNHKDADSLGKYLAEMLRKSSGHWAYVGSSEFSYTGVGCTKNKTTWYVCIMVGRTNYG